MLLPDDYFKVYAEKLGVTSGPKEAFWETEKEFARRYSCSRPDVVLRRFKNYKSFRVSYNNYKKHGWPESIEVVIMFDETDYSKIK